MSEEAKPANGETAPAEEEEINILDLLAVLAGHWRMIIGAAAAAFVLACLVSLLLPNIYTATARILPPQKDNGGLGSLLGGGMGDLAALAGVRVGSTPGELYVGMLKSRTIADAIIDRFELMQVYEQEYRTDMYRTLNGLASFSLGKADGIISISVEDEDPQRAADIANAYMEELKKLNVQLNLSTAGRERSFLEERLAVVGRDLEEAEERLKKFQEENKAIRIDEQTRGLIEAIAQLKGEQASKEVELGVLLSYQTERNPQVRALRESIAQIREQIRRLERSGGGKAGEDVFFATSEVPELGLQFARLMRDYKVQETLYELLTKQYEIAKISEAKNTSTLQVLDEAAPPDRKSKPKRALIAILATIVAGLLAMLAAFIREFGRNMGEEDRRRWEQIKADLRRSKG